VSLKNGRIGEDGHTEHQNIKEGEARKKSIFLLGAASPQSPLHPVPWRAREYFVVVLTKQF
jgi:hypothetical protein